MNTGDRVALADDDSVIGTVVTAHTNGWIVVQWDEWYGHADQVLTLDRGPCPDCGGPGVTWEDGYVLCDACARKRAVAARDDRLGGRQ